MMKNKLKKVIPVAMGMTLLFSVGSAFAATPATTKAATAKTAVTATQTSTATTSLTCGSYTISFDQSTLAANTSLQKALGLTEAQLKAKFAAGQTLSTLAKNKGIDVSKLTSILLQSPLAQMNTDVKAGKLTQTQLNTYKAKLLQLLNEAAVQKIAAKTTAAASKPATQATSQSSASSKTAVNEHFQWNTAASLLGLGQDELKTKVQAGKTIAEIAKEKGIDEQKVIDAVVTAEKTEFAAQLAKPWSGTNALTADEQQQFIDNGYLTAAAGVLGITESELQTQLKAGKSIESLCSTKNVSIDKVKTALTTCAEKNAKTQVSSSN